MPVRWVLRREVGNNKVRVDVWGGPGIRLILGLLLSKVLIHQHTLVEGFKSSHQNHRGVLKQLRCPSPTQVLLTLWKVG